jgi:hypothetical protein
MYDQYKSARLVSASGKLQKNKGVMLVGVSGDACQLQLKGMSGGAWVDSSVGLTLGTGQNSAFVPIQTYGCTLGSGKLFELN